MLISPWFTAHINLLRHSADSQKREGNILGALRSELCMLKILSNIEPPNSRSISDVCVRLSLTFNLAGDFFNGEIMARTGLQLREKHYSRDAWQIASAQSALGVSLVGRKAFAEAKPFLTRAFTILNIHRSIIPRKYHIRIRETAQNLLVISEAIGTTQEALHWSAVVKAFDSQFPPTGDE